MTRYSSKAKIEEWLKQTKAKLISALRFQLRALKTTMIIAHRFSTITHADMILVLKDGEIVQRGKHEELVLEDGLYKELWHQQSNVKAEEE